MRLRQMTSICAFLACMHGGMALADDAAAPPDGFKMVLAQTWQGNPQLRAARSALDVAAEDIAYARSYWGPTASGSAGILSRHSYPDSFGSSSGETKTLKLEVVQPVYRGGKTVSAVKAAQSRVQSAEQSLLGVEQQVLLEAATAYMDLLRDTEIVRLHKNSEKVLENQKEAAKTRFELGDVSKTDVSQAEARLAEARASRIRAEGNLKQTQAVFERVIGSPPEGEIKKPSMAFSIPATLDEALVRSENKNPDVLKAAFDTEAGKHDTRTLFGEILPEVNLTGTATRTYNPSFGGADQQDNATVELAASIPLYSSGRAAARIRQSRQQENQDRIEIEVQKRSIREQTVAAWENLSASQAEVEARKAQVAAAEIAFEGIGEETKLGARTTLELLDSEQELLDAQTSLVVADRDVTVAFFRLLCAMGEMTGENLGLAALGQKSEGDLKYGKSKKGEDLGAKGAN